MLVLLLLSAGRTIPATTLIDRLWSESSLPVDPMNALQIRASKLRRALAVLGGELVSRELVGYRINVDPSAIDAEQFLDLLREARTRANAAGGGYSDADLGAYDDALALRAGDPLSDFVTERWAIAEAARLNKLRLAAMTERTQIALALGRHLEAVGDLEAAVPARAGAAPGQVPQRPQRLGWRRTTDRSPRSQASPAGTGPGSGSGGTPPSQ